MVYTYIVLNQMKMVHDDIRHKLPWKLLIPSHQLHIIHIIGHGKQKFFKNNNKDDTVSYFSGEFGEVYKARLTGGKIPRVVAVKTLRGEKKSWKVFINIDIIFILWINNIVGLYSPNDVQQMVDEIVKMKDFTHYHVMSLIGVCLDISLAIVMPYMANGSVLDYLKREKNILLLSEEAEPEEV